MFEIFQHPFMIRAFIAGVVVAIIAPIIGNYLVVRRYSLMSDTLSHVALMGVAIGMAMGGNPVVTATIATVVAALGIERLRSSRLMMGESVLSLFLSGSLAIASIIGSFTNGFRLDLFSFLFGSIVAVSRNDLWYIFGLSAIVILTVSTCYPKFFFMSFDEEIAQASGIRVAWYNSVIVVLAALTIAVAMRIVGVLLIGALMVIPVLTVMQFHRGFRSNMMWSVCVSIIAVTSGIVISYYADIASGGTIVAVALTLFVGSLLFNHSSA